MKELIIKDATDIINIKIGDTQDGTVISGEELLNALGLYFSTKEEMEGENGN